MSPPSTDKKEEEGQDLYEFLAELGYSPNDLRGETLEEKARSLKALIKQLESAGHIKKV